MLKARANLGFSDALDDFNPSEWSPQKATNDRSPKDAMCKAAAAAGFRSREPQIVPAPDRAGESVAPRRRRTGRNTQFNLKAKPETITAFCAIADRQGWGLGETLEHAVALLERELSP